ncbi:hypothetical protein GCM10009119_17420 [Algoriphagus jejuensis]|uniref:Uncharacterized protein n=1 Tax=Algoriphagus jejuensis TaxID=419934 RepID=A0ABP3YDA6_9BACT
MQTSVNTYLIPHLVTGKKHDDDVDKGTNRKTPGNNQGARPPEEEDFDEIHERGKKVKKKEKTDN